MLTSFPHGSPSVEADPMSRLEHPADRATGNSRIGHVPSAPYIKPKAYVDPSGLQYVAYFDEHRWLTVASRMTWGEPWRHTRIESQLAWDSHNYASLVTDRSGCVHLAGNMHATPLTYFRTRLPGDLDALERIDVMVCRSVESQVTYPEFLVGPDSALSFWFRDGLSGRGEQRLYVFDESRARWLDPLAGPLITGEGHRSAYLEDNRARADCRGYWMTWVWRDSPDAESTHSICYAESADLVVWRNVQGEVLDLPLRVDSVAAIAAPQPGMGLINNNVTSVRNAQGRPTIVYHLRDAEGRMQVWRGRWDGSQWQTSALTDWDVVWDFHGPGSLSFDLEIGRPLIRDRKLAVPVRHRERVVELVEADGHVTGQVAPPPWSGIDGLIRDGIAYGLSHYEGARSRAVVLAWTSLAPTTDQPPARTPPPPAPLRIGHLS